ncbi:MAG: hypothetical protein Q9222_002572 [Ikaeria aurantiellina]
MPPKRKQTPDMPQSPPKRVTRARAKNDVDSKAGTNRTAMASTKASAKKTVTKQKTAPPSKINKSKDESREDVDTVMEEDLAIEQPAVEPSKTRDKAKAAAETTLETTVNAVPASNAPAKSTRSCTNDRTATKDQEAPLPKPKGRPKKNAPAEAPVAAENPNPDTEVAPSTKPARGRTVNVVTKSMAARTKTAATAPKKKVKFDDQAGQDKENDPIVLKGQKKTEPKATGLKAKPVRRPATTRAGAKGAKAAKAGAKPENETTPKDVLPLSPKKVTQVAKTPSVGSEDELAGDKTPARPLNASPSKIPLSISRNTESTIGQPDLEVINAPSSPTRTTSPLGLATSPRKPPPSPFKNILHSSPRRLDLAVIKSPQKLDASASPPKSPLKESPKRINLSGLDAQPVLQWSKTPSKSSSLQSPARRPGGSLMKTPSRKSPMKDGMLVPVVDASTASEQVNTFKLPALSTEVALSSALQTESPQLSSIEVHDENKKSSGNQSRTTQDLSPSKVLKSNSGENIATPEANGGLVKEDVVGRQINEAPASDSPLVHLLEQDDSSSLDSSGHSSSVIGNAGGKAVDRFDDMLQTAHDTTCDGLEDQMAARPSEQFPKRVFNLASPMFASKVEDSESEDELASPQKAMSPSPLKHFGVSTKDFGELGQIDVQEDHTPSRRLQRASVSKSARKSTGMTPLVLQMSSWFASSPEKNNATQAGQKRGIFSPALPALSKVNKQSLAASAVGSPAKPSFFEDEMAIRDTTDIVLMLDEDSTDELQDNDNEELYDINASQESHTSEVYGDENAAPEGNNTFLVAQQSQDRTLTCTPARVFERESREVHTVSKVPLRPAADDTPLHVPRKRSRSIAGPLADLSLPNRISLSGDSALSPILQDTNLRMSMLPGDPAAPDTPKTPTASLLPASQTPGRSSRKAGYTNVLKGAVVHVDVHTTEGADASGIFVDLLTQMGARCVKQWHWNPYSTIEAEQQDLSPKGSDSPNGKVGITHVVYKDGGKRTLEKVREAKGVVLCVGVGWVLDCEREDKWLDELDYAVDTLNVPRGGSRRRKSMEPRALANLNGNLIPAETPIKGSAVEMSPTKEFLTFDTPASRRETFEFNVQDPATPAEEQAYDNNDNNEIGQYDSPLSPTTPYYLSKGAKLVQQTCPPKQSHELFFPLSGNIEDQPNEAVRQRLLMARRKSLQWASKVQSPLGRTVSYGK